LSAEDKDALEAFQHVLAFYGTQLQSHAATIISLSIGAFTLLQVSLSLGQGSGIGRVALSFALLAMIFAITVLTVYVFLRLLVYGQLSKAILYGSFPDFEEFKREYIESRDGNWNMLFPYTKVSYYANSHFQKRWLKEKHLRNLLKGAWVYNKRAQPRMGLPMIIGLVSATFFLLLFVIPAF